MGGSGSKTKEAPSTSPYSTHSHLASPILFPPKPTPASPLPKPTPAPSLPKPTPAYPVLKPTPAPLPKPTPAPLPKPTPAPSLPKPAPIAAQNQSVRIASPIPQHDANNYIISKTNSNNVMVAKDFMVPYRTKVDRYMKVCPKYQSKKGCNAQYCYRFHVCPYWIRDNCKKDNCYFDHNLPSPHNNIFLRHLLTARFTEVDMKEKLKTYMFSGKAMREDLADCICMDNILKKCKRSSNCVAKHFDSQYVWQVYSEGNWTEIPKSVSDSIEEHFRDPQHSRVEINPKLGGPARQNSQIRQLFGCHSIRIDFESMSLTSQNKFFRIKRLSTPSDVASFSSVATRWLWYWEDLNGKWQFYTSAVVNDFYVMPFSDYIEREFLKKERTFSFKIPSGEQFEYTLNLENMVQINKRTVTERKIKRRPIPFLENPNWKDDTTFRSLWTNAISDKKYQRQHVSPTSCEFHFVRQMVSETVSLSGVVIERVENQHLWQAYQLKKSQMLTAFNGNSTSLNEQYLFHGTCESVLDKICAENLDWRLYGTNVGNVFGRGTYFAKEASLSSSYAQSNEEGFKYMFIVLVLVGTAAVGNSSMTLPPIHPTTNKRFDSTVNNENPTILVKYNLDEYYPAYLLKFRSLT